MARWAKLPFSDKSYQNDYATKIHLSLSKHPNSDEFIAKQHIIIYMEW